MTENAPSVAEMLSVVQNVTATSLDVNTRLAMLRDFFDNTPATPEPVKSLMHEAVQVVAIQNKVIATLTELYCINNDAFESLFETFEKYLQD